MVGPARHDFYRRRKTFPSNGTGAADPHCHFSVKVREETSGVDIAATKMEAKTALRVLLIEGSAADALLIVRELRRGGYEPTWERVGTAARLSDALLQQRWDVITCDYVMPHFGALEALQLMRARSTLRSSSSPAKSVRRLRLR